MPERTIIDRIIDVTLGLSIIGLIYTVISVFTRVLTAQELRVVLKEEVAKITRANRAYKGEVDLATARDNASLIEEWGLSGKAPFFSLTILRVGNGAFKLRTYFTETDYVEYTQDEIYTGYVIERQFTDLRLTNTSQTVVNPCLIVDWREE